MTTTKKGYETGSQELPESTIGTVTQFVARIGEIKKEHIEQGHEDVFGC